MGDANPFDLSGTVAVVTGGNSGIGLGLARGLAKAGADVAVCGRDEARNADAVKELERMGVRAAGIACDVGQESQVGAATAATPEALGRIDGGYRIFETRHPPRGPRRRIRPAAPRVVPRRDT